MKKNDNIIVFDIETRNTFRDVGARAHGGLRLSIMVAYFYKDDMDKVKLMIDEVAAGLRQQNYKAKPTYMACQYCPYKQICPHTLK